MQKQTSLVVTSIAAPNPVLQSLAQGCLEHGHKFYVIGDVPSPADFSLEGCDFYSLERQALTGLKFAQMCPKKHYARKNIGYLLAIREGAEIIVETDDDNFPRASFWNDRVRSSSVPVATQRGWLNAYAYFSDANIWPRGLPLDAVRSQHPTYESFAVQSVDAPIQQGLADENPDVDAIYRLLLPLPLDFRADRQLALVQGCGVRLTVRTQRGGATLSRCCICPRTARSG